MAAVCECGYRFREGDAVSESDIARAVRKKKLRAAVGTAVVVAVIAVLALLTVFGGVKVLLIVLGCIVAVLLVAFVVLKVCGFLDGRRKR